MSTHTVVEQGAKGAGAPHFVRQPSPWPQHDVLARPALGPRRGVETSDPRSNWRVPGVSTPATCSTAWWRHRTSGSVCHQSPHRHPGAGRDPVRRPTDPTTTAPAWLRRRTSGSVSIEAVMIIPAFLLFLALIAAVGRTAGAQADIHAAAVEGARITSLASTAAAGDKAAQKAIKAHLTKDKVTCQPLTISINSQALDKPVGQAGTVSATITCVITLSDLAVPGLPGTITLTDSYAVPIDPYALR